MTPQQEAIIQLRGGGDLANYNPSVSYDPNMAIKGKPYGDMDIRNVERRIQEEHFRPKGTRDFGIGQTAYDIAMAPGALVSITAEKLIPMLAEQGVPWAMNKIKEGALDLSEAFGREFMSDKKGPMFETPDDAKLFKQQQKVKQLGEDIYNSKKNINDKLGEWLTY